MSKTVPIICRGIQFPSVAAMCVYFGVERYKTHSRIQRGWTPEEAAGLVERVESIYRPKPVSFDGVDFPNLKAAAAALGWKDGTVQARIARGLSVEDALRGHAKPRVGYNTKPVEFQGKKFRSKEELASTFGLTGPLFAKRVKQGWTVEQALEIEPPPPRFRNFEGHAREQKWKEVRVSDGKVEPVPDADGYKLYLVTNSVNFKVYVGLTVGALTSRLKQHFAAARRGRMSAFANAIRKHGEDVFRIEQIANSARTYDELQEQEVLEISKRDAIKSGYNTAKGGSLGTAKGLVVEDRQFQSYLEAAAHYGVDPAVMALRLGRLKWTPEEAVGLVSRDWEGKEVAVTIAGKAYPSIRSAALAFGLSYKLVHDRYRAKGWTLEQAVGVSPPPETAKYSGMFVKVFGKKYKSFGEAGRALGINPESFRKRIQTGMTPEMAYGRARKKTPLPQHFATKPVDLL